MAGSKYELNQKLPEIPYCLFYDCMGRYVPSHWHREIEVVMCKKGTVKMAINNVAYELEKDDMVVIPDGSTHLYYNSPGNERMVVFLDYSLFEKGESYRGTNRTQLHNRIRQIPLSSCQWSEENRIQVKSILEALELLNGQNVFAWDLAVQAKVCELMFYLCNHVEKTVNVESANVETLLKLESVLEYIEKNYCKQINLKDAAAYFGFSTSYFARFFKKYSGETFMNYLNAYRINKARDILFLDSRKTVSQISEQVGIPNVKTFNRLFRQITGTSPTQYRKSAAGIK